MRYLFTLLSCLTLLAFASGCKGKNAKSSLLNTRWMLVQVEEFPILASSYSDTHRSYIEFTSNDRTTGLGPCNTFSGSFSLKKEPGLLTISPQASTRASCPALGIETKYLEALSRTVSYQIRGKKLSLYDVTNTTRPLLIFEDRTSD